MPLFDVITLSAIIAVFGVFILVVGGLTWYCSDKRKRPFDRAGQRDYGYPSDGKLITDDD